VPPELLDQLSSDSRAVTGGATSPSGRGPSVLLVKVMVAIYAVVLIAGFAYFTVAAFAGN
jgi:hypothetical protein